MARDVTCCYVGTGRNACATELRIAIAFAAVGSRPREQMRDLRHAVPLLPEKSENEERERDGAKHRRWRRVLTQAQSSFSRAAYRRTPVLLKALSPLGEGLVLGWRYRWCSRGAPVLLHWLWKTSASGRGKCGTYRVPWKMVRAGFSLKPTYYFAGLRFCVHLYQRGARHAAHSEEAPAISEVCS